MVCNEKYKFGGWIHINYIISHISIEEVLVLLQIVQEVIIFFLFKLSKNINKDVTLKILFSDYVGVKMKTEEKEQI